MTKTQQHTAILIFAHSSKKEATIKTFKKSEVFFKELNSIIVKKVKRAGLPYFIVNENNQIGNTFGERFANALRDIYNLGFKNIISIGNDTPQLKTSDLIKASTFVDYNNYVLGNSKNGGFYLLALNADNFNYVRFKNLPWQTNALKNKLEKGLKSNCDAFYLSSTLKDINSKHDLKYFINYFKKTKQSLFFLITSILKKQVFLTSNIKTFISYFFLQINYNKGSPAISF